MEESVQLWLQTLPQKTSDGAQLETEQYRDNLCGSRLSNLHFSSLGFSGLLHGVAIILSLTFLVHRNDPRPPPRLVEIVTMVSLVATQQAEAKSFSQPPVANEALPPPPVVAPKFTPRPVSKTRLHVPKIVSEQSPRAPLEVTHAVSSDEQTKTSFRSKKDDSVHSVDASAALQVANAEFMTGKSAATANSSFSAAKASATHQQSEYNHLNLGKIRNAIADNLVFPTMARKMGWKGRVVVSFSVLPSGRVADISIITSSGREILDRNVVLAVEKSVPFPPSPVAVRILLPISYNLQ